jgi:Na+/H+ antiporter NhaC
VMAILLFAWALGDVCADLGTARFLVATLGSSFDPGWLPTVVFLVSAVVSFATGTSWGTMGILFPLAVPLAHELATPDPNLALLVATISSILAGSVFGDHCSPISDTTIMSALASGCDQIAHVRTQLPYALLVAAVSVVCGSIPDGFGFWPPWVGLCVGLGVLYVVLRVGSGLDARRASRER